MTPPPEPADGPAGVRERTQRAIRAELTGAALALFAAKGFDETTVDDIVATVGVSRRTFFRYFASKEDAVLQSLDATGAALAQRLAQRPAGEPPLEALRRTFDVFAEEFEADRGRWLALMALGKTTPAIRARHLDKQDSWLDAMSAALAARMGVPPQDRHPRAFCAIALAAADVELTAVSAQASTADVHAALDRAVSAIRELALQRP